MRAGDSASHPLPGLGLLHALPSEQPGLALSQLWFQITFLVQQGHCKFKSRLAPSHGSITTTAVNVSPLLSNNCQRKCFLTQQLHECLCCLGDPEPRC